MRRNRLSAVTFLSAAFFSLVLVFSGSAAADSMNFIGPGGNNSVGSIPIRTISPSMVARPRR